MIQGSLVAIVTPMHADGSLDIAALRKLIDWHIAEGTDGIVIVGTSGESPTVSVEEHCELIRVTVEHAARRVPIIAGSGGNSTAEAIRLTQFAKEVGADASLQVVPYYNRPNQEGMYQHFRKIAEAVDLPIILYNVPGRTVADMSNETVLRLAAIPNIVGIKDATGDLGRVSWMRANINGRFDLISGDDPSYLGYHAQGGVGVISVTSNVAPEAMVALHEAAAAGDYATARDWQDRLIALHKALFLDNSPSPAKYALSRMQLCSEEVRLPLALTADAVKPAIDQAMADAGLD